MAAYLSPVFGAGAQLFSNQGIVLSGGKIYTYQAGTTTPLGTWTDSTQTVSNANPIILDSTGRLTTEIWLQESSTYKFILTDADDNPLGIAWDNIAGLNDITASVTVSEWTATGLTPTYISSTSFSVSGNNTSTFVLNRRVKIVVSAGTVYGYVVSSSFSTPNTTIVIRPDSTVLDAGISSVSVGLQDSTNVSVPNQYLAANAPISIASASTTNIGAALSLTVSITGTTTITAFDTVLAGIYRYVSWTDATPVTYNVTSMQLVGNENRTYAAGDFSIFRSLGSGNWSEELYQSHNRGLFATQTSDGTNPVIFTDIPANKNFELEIIGAAPTNASYVLLSMQMSTDNGSTYYTTAGDYASNWGSGGAASYNVIGLASMGGTSYLTVVKNKIFNLGISGVKYLTGTYFNDVPTAYVNGAITKNATLNTSAVNAIKFFTGNTASPSAAGGAIASGAIFNLYYSRD